MRPSRITLADKKEEDKTEKNNKVLDKIWNSEILRKQNFPQNLKLADITPDS